MTKASKKRPKVSVVLATFNGEKYIKMQIDSILKNLEPNDEIIVTDDGSTDKTLDVIKKIDDNRITIYDGPREGVQQNFAYGISKCKGDYIFLCDQDDYWEEDKVDIVLDTFLKNDECLCVVHDAVVVNNNMTKIIIKSYFEFRNTKSGFLINFIRPSYLGCCMAISKVAIKYILPIPSKVEMHDRWIGSICDFYGKTVFINNKLIKYRRHENNVSKMKRNNIFTILKNRIYLLSKLIIRRIKVK